MYRIKRKMIFFEPLQSNMGIKGLTAFMKDFAADLSKAELAKFATTVSLCNISASTIVIDYSMLAFRYGPTLVKGDMQAMSSGVLKGFLRLMHEYQVLKIRPIVVFDQVEEDVDGYAAVYDALGKMKKDAYPIDAASVLQVKTQTKIDRIDERAHQKEKQQKEQFSVTDELIESTKAICEALGIEYYHPVVEADWLIAYLASYYSEKGDTYILTDDTDLFIYDIGKARLLRSYSMLEKKRLSGTTYEMVNPSIVWDLLEFDQPRRAYFGAVLGCDYSNGVCRLGPKKVLHLLTLDPSMHHAKTMKRDGLSELIVCASFMISSDGTVDSSTWESLPLQTKKAFTARLISPTCFEGISASNLAGLKAPFFPPLPSVDHFVTECYSSPLNSSDFSKFRNAIAILIKGPSIEGVHIEERGIKVGGGREEPMDNVENAVLATFLYKRLGKAYFNLEQGLLDMGVDLHGQIISDEQAKMDSLFIGE